MQITDVSIRNVEKEGKMKAVVSITIDEEFVVHDIKIIEGEKGLFIAMPSRKAADGEYPSEMVLTNHRASRWSLPIFRGFSMFFLRSRW